MPLVPLRDHILRAAVPESVVLEVENNLLVVIVVDQSAGRFSLADEILVADFSEQGV